MCSCLSRCSCIILAFYYVMCPYVIMWQMCLLLSSGQIMFALCYDYGLRYVHGLCSHLSFVGLFMLLYMALYMYVCGHPIIT